MHTMQCAKHLCANVLCLTLAILYLCQTVVERFNFEINMRVLIFFRHLIDYMEANCLLSKEDIVQVHAFSVLAQPLCQHGLDLLVCKSCIATFFLGSSCLSRLQATSPCAPRAIGGFVECSRNSTTSGTPFNRWSTRSAKARSPTSWWTTTFASLCHCSV